jgi:hypothetical protein
MFKQLSSTHYLQLVLFGILVMVGTLVFTGLGYVAGMAIWGQQEIQNALAGILDSTISISIMKMFQIMSQLAIFVVPPLVLYFIIRKTHPSFMGLNVAPKGQQLLLVFGLFVAILPIIQYTMELNSAMHLPQSLWPLEEWMREKEDAAAILTTKFLETASWNGFMANVLMLAILPALGEELVFRGLMMQWFSKVFKNIHLNIFIVAVIFSAIHIQFFGFFPRLLLGIVLGYAYYWTSSLWVAIWLHFVNNFFTVVTYFWIFNQNNGLDPEEVGSLDNPWLLLLSVLATSTLLWTMYQRRKTAKFVST